MMTPNNPYKTHLFKSHYNMSKKTEKPLQIFFKNIWVITKYFQHLWIEAFKKDQ